MSRLNFVAMLAVLLWLVNSHDAIGQGRLPFQTLALTGQPAPNSSDGTTFSTFSRPVLNAAGQVAFVSRLSGGNTPPAESLLLFGSDGLTEVAKTGKVTSGSNGSVTLNSIQSRGGVSINGRGNFSFIAEVSGLDRPQNVGHALILHSTAFAKP